MPRCLKPNHGKVANQFDEELVQEQLRYNGILEISYIRNQGWPVRFTFEEFLKRYKFISYPQSSPIRANAITCEKILHALSFTDVVIGKSKVIERKNESCSLFDGRVCLLGVFEISTYRNVKSTL